MRFSAKKGFTLIELLIVVVIIGILAAIAIPKFSNTKEKAYIASMKSDLRNMATAQEAYFADNQSYITTGNATSPDSIAALHYIPSAGVKVTLGTSTNGWSAVAEHNATSKKCAMFIGGTPQPPAVIEGEPKCDQ